MVDGKEVSELFDAHFRVAFAQSLERLEQMTNIANFWAGLAAHYAKLLDEYRRDPLADLFPPRRTDAKH